MSETRLDGNALAGLLGELLGVEMTLASTACAGCGARESVGALLVYQRAPGTGRPLPPLGGRPAPRGARRRAHGLDLRGVRSLDTGDEV